VPIKYETRGEMIRRVYELDALLALNKASMTTEHSRIELLRMPVLNAKQLWFKRKNELLEEKVKLVSEKTLLTVQLSALRNQNRERVAIPLDYEKEIAHKEAVFNAALSHITDAKTKNELIDLWRAAK